MVEGLRRCGVTDSLGRVLRRLTEHPAYLAVTGVAALASSFASDVGVVALVIPLVMASDAPWSARRLLLPMALAALMTLVGSSSNLVANQFLAGQSGHGLGLFALLPVGLAVSVSGLAVAMLSRRLRAQRPPDSGLPDLTSLQPYCADVRVLADSSLDGQPIERLVSLGLRVLRLERGGVPVRLVLPDTRLKAGDLLTVCGDVGDLLDEASASGLEMVGAGGKEALQRLAGEGMSVVQAVLPPESRLVGRTLRQDDYYRWRTGLDVLAISRRGRVAGGRLRDVRLAAGDLVVLAGSVEALAREAELGQFVPLGDVPLRAKRRGRLLVALGIFVLALAAAAAGRLPLVVALGSGVAAMLLTGCLRGEEMYAAIDWRVFVSVAALVPLGTAATTSGLATAIAGAFTTLTNGWPPVAELARCHAFTAILAQFIHHTAAAAVATPLALSLAAARHLSPTAFVVAVIVAAAATPVTPICNKVNLLVMEPGSYSWRDYLVVGLPVALVAGLVSLLLIPHLWPLGG